MDTKKINNETQSQTSQSQHNRKGMFGNWIDGATQRGEAFFLGLARSQREGAEQFNEVTEQFGRFGRASATAFSAMTAAFCDLAAASVRGSRELWPRR